MTPRMCVGDRADLLLVGRTAGAWRRVLPLMLPARLLDQLRRCRGRPGSSLVTTSRDLAVLADDERRPRREALVVEIDAVLAGHVALGMEVGQQRIRDPVLRRERLVRPERVDRDAEDLDASLGGPIAGRISAACLVSFEQVGEKSSG